MMELHEKAFELGVIVGRFQVLHKGHADMIRKAAMVCSRLAIFVGSSQESGTLKNPLSYEMRARLLKKAFPEIDIYPIPDIGVGNTFAWGEYVLNTVKDCTGRLPDVIVTGYETRRHDWIDEKWKIAQLIIPKSIDISASRMIQYMIQGDRKSWEQYIEPSLCNCYEQMRIQVLSSKEQLQTASI